MPADTQDHPPGRHSLTAVLFALPVAAYHAAVRHPVALLVLAVLAAAAGAAVWLYLPPPKKSVAVVYHIDAHPPTLLPQPPESPTEFGSYMRAQMALVKSRRTLLVALDPAKHPEVANLQVVRNARPDIVTWLDRSLTVDSRPESEYLRVILEGDDEAELLILLRAIDRAYLRTSHDRDNQVRFGRQKSLEDRLKQAREELKKFQAAIDEIARVLGARDEVTLALLASDLRADFSQEWRRGRALEDALELARVRLEAAKRVDARKAAPAVAGAWVEVGLAQLESRFDEDQLPAAQAEFDRLQFERDRNRVRFGEIAAEIDRHNRYKAHLDAIKADMTTKDQVAAALAVQSERMRVEDRSQPARVTVAEEPYVFTRTDGDGRWTFALLAAAGVFAVGFGGVVCWEAGRRSARAFGPSPPDSHPGTVS